MRPQQIPLQTLCLLKQSGFCVGGLDPSLLPSSVRSPVLAAQQKGLLTIFKTKPVPGFFRQKRSQLFYKWPFTAVLGSNAFKTRFAGTSGCNNEWNKMEGRFSIFDNHDSTLTDHSLHLFYCFLGKMRSII